MLIHSEALFFVLHRLKMETISQAKLVFVLIKQIHLHHTELLPSAFAMLWW